jgi:hypothetical protein
MRYNSIYLIENKNLTNVQSDLELALSHLNDVSKNFSKVPYGLMQAIGKVEDFLNSIESEIEEDQLQEEYEKIA